MPQSQSTEQDDFRRLADPDFLAERRRVREALEHAPEQSPDRARLAARYEAMSAEFDRRASRAWAAAS
jgi:hypothetical protein